MMTYRVNSPIISNLKTLRYIPSLYTETQILPIPIYSIKLPLKISSSNSHWRINFRVFLCSLEYLNVIKWTHKHINPLFLSTHVLIYLQNFWMCENVKIGNRNPSIGIGTKLQNRNKTIGSRIELPSWLCCGLPFSLHLLSHLLAKIMPSLRCCSAPCWYGSASLSKLTSTSFNTTLHCKHYLWLVFLSSMQNPNSHPHT